MRRLIAALGLLAWLCVGAAAQPTGTNTVGSSSLVIGTTPIAGGATTQVLFNLAGKVTSDSGLVYAGSSGTFTIDGNWAFTTNGFFARDGSTGGFFLGSANRVAWSNNADGALGSPDIGLGRNAAGVLEVNSSTACAGTPANCRDLVVRHATGGGTAPTANTCTGFSLLAGGSDLGGKVTLTSGTTCSINFGVNFTNAPACTVSPGSAASTILVTTSTSLLSITFGTAQTAFAFTCIGA